MSDVTLETEPERDLRPGKREATTSELQGGEKEALSVSQLLREGPCLLFFYF